MTAPEANRLIPHKQPDKAQLVVYAGRRGEGKTFGINDFIQTAEPRVLAFDPFEDFDGIIESPTVEEALADMGHWTTACRRRVCPPINDDTHEFADEAFSQIIGESETPLRNALLVLDEITLWSEYRAKRALKTLIFQGRRLGIRMLVASQRLALVPDAMLSEATHMVLFKFVRPRDLDVLANWTDEETAAICSNLSPHQCVYVEL